MTSCPSANEWTLQDIGETIQYQTTAKHKKAHTVGTIL